ncbi:MAG TPA: calcium-binding protein [Solirubrobacteraceae bacterium]|jgi:Ca2+-binding RTX toxin-like protein
MRRALTLALFAVLVAAAPATAATVTYTAGYVEPPGTDPDDSCSRYMMCPPGASLDIVDGSGERNDLTVEATATTVVVRDAAAPLEARGGCTKEADGSVRCPFPGSFTVRAGGADDRVVSPGGAVDGGDGDDDLFGHDVQGGAGNDTLHGTPNGDQLRGGAGADVIDAADGDDYVTDDDRSVTGGSPAPDRLDGGPGLDSIAFQSRTAPLRIDLGNPQTAGEAGEGNVVSGFESASGSAGDDVILGPQSSVDRFTLEGGGGADHIESRSATRDASVRGGDGNDDLVGSVAGNDRLQGDAGDDTLNGFGGEDSLEGGDGDDRIIGGDDDDLLTGDAGRDAIAGARGNDSIDGGAGPDSVTGAEGDDKLNGGSGEDDLEAGPGADRAFGGRGDDAVFGRAGDDTISGGAGRDLLRGGSGRDRISARDGRADDTDCGSGRDTATLDRRERARGCERANRPKRRG